MTSIDLSMLREVVGLRDLEAASDARIRLRELVTRHGSLGQLGTVAVWLAGAQGHCPPLPLADARIVFFAGDHGITRDDPSVVKPSGDGGPDVRTAPVTTSQLMRGVINGQADICALARLNGVGVRVVDIAVDDATDDLPSAVTLSKVRRGSGSIDREDALTDSEVTTAFHRGVAIADQEVNDGANLLIASELGTGASTVAAALIGGLTGAAALDVIHVREETTESCWAHTVGVLRDALYRARPFQHDPLSLLRTVGGGDVAAMTGFLIQAAARRTPVLLDGVVSAAAALLGRRLVESSGQWWLAAERSPEPAQRRVLDLLGLTPLIDLGIDHRSGTAALTALPLLRAAQTILAAGDTTAGQLADLTQTQ